MVWRRCRNDGIQVTRGCSTGSMTLVDDSSNTGVEARVIGSSSISGSMKAQSSSSSSGDHMLLRSGALVRLATPIACGISLSPLRLQERQRTDSTFAHGVAPEGIGT